MNVIEISESVEWTQDDEYDMVNPIPVVTDKNIFAYMDTVDQFVFELYLEEYPEDSKLSYPALRKKLISTYGDLQQVDIKKIRATEKYLKRAHLSSLRNKTTKTSSDYPLLYKLKNIYYVGDGNHRITRAFEDEERKVLSVVMDYAKIKERHDGDKKR